MRHFSRGATFPGAAVISGISVRKIARARARALEQSRTHAHRLTKTSSHSIDGTFRAPSRLVISLGHEITAGSRFESGNSVERLRERVAALRLLLDLGSPDESREPTRARLLFVNLRNFSRN